PPCSPPCPARRSSALVGGDRPARLHRPAAGLPGAGALACPPAALLVGGAHQRPSSAQRCRSSAISSSSEGYPNGFGTRGPSGTGSVKVRWYRGSNTGTGSVTIRV